MMAITTPSGLPIDPSPVGRPALANRPTSAETKARNDELLSLARVLGWTTARIARLYRLSVSTVQDGIREARARSEAHGGADPAPAVDGDDVSLQDMLETPMEVYGRKFYVRDDEDAIKFIKANSHAFPYYPRPADPESRRPADPGSREAFIEADIQKNGVDPPPLSRGLRRRRPTA